MSFYLGKVAEVEVSDAVGFSLVSGDPYATHDDDPIQSEIDVPAGAYLFAFGVVADADCNTTFPDCVPGVTQAFSEQFPLFGTLTCAALDGGSATNRSGSNWPRFSQEAPNLASVKGQLVSDLAIGDDLVATWAQPALPPPGVPAAFDYLNMTRTSELRTRVVVVLAFAADSLLYVWRPIHRHATDPRSLESCETSPPGEQALSLGVATDGLEPNTDGGVPPLSSLVPFSSVGAVIDPDEIDLTLEAGWVEPVTHDNAFVRLHTLYVSNTSVAALGGDTGGHPWGSSFYVGDVLGGPFGIRATAGGYVGDTGSAGDTTSGGAGTAPTAPIGIAP